MGETGAESVWVPVVVRNRPERWDAYDSHVVFEVQLPPGSGSGPLVYKPYLREIGRHSAPGYRAALGLCYLWDRYGANNGRFIQATIPRLARNDDGDLLGVDGSVLLTKQGQPVHQYMIGKGKDRQLRPDVVALDEQDNLLLREQAAHLLVDLLIGNMPPGPHPHTQTSQNKQSN
ncbi:MAG: hypothetical protein OXF50_24495 [Caldilineaceae bacterium]|nr:hypothetical protein [Caldilineaceae bacterium]